MNKEKVNKQILSETPVRIYNKRTDCSERIIAKQLGKRYIEYRRKWIRVSKRKLVSEFPFYIQIEHSGRCNLSCPFCIQGIGPLRENYSRGFKPLDIKLYIKILNEAKQYKCPSISFHNNDEPLLLNDLEDRIKLAKEAGFIDIILTTNATLLNQDRARRLLKSGITKINFSVDAYNAKDYRERRGCDDFNIVLNNIGYFLEQKKRANLKLPVTRVTCVLTKFSVKNMDDFYKFWENKVDLIEFQNFQAIKNYTEKFSPSETKIGKSFKCNTPWQQLVIRANGDVLPCCSFYGNEMVMGNIKDASLYSIWNSEQMKIIRRELLRNNYNFSSTCKKCSETIMPYRDL